MKNSNVPKACPICNSCLLDITNQMNYLYGSRFCSTDERHYSIMFKHRSPTGQFSAHHEHVTQEIYKTKHAILNIFYDYMDAYPSEPCKANLSWSYGSDDLIEIKLDMLKEYFTPKDSKKFIERIMENLAFL